MRGRTRADLMWQDDPSDVEIAWAAGFYEGEGSVNHQRGSIRASIFQNEDWPLLRIKRWFGGSVRPYRVGHLWYSSGKVTDRFMEMIKPHLSPRRVRQYEAALGGLEAHRAR